MKMLKNMAILAVVCYAVAIAMNDDNNRTSVFDINMFEKELADKPLGEKLEIIKQEKKQSIKRFQAALRTGAGQEAVEKAADAASRLDQLETDLRITQSKLKIDALQEELKQAQEATSTGLRSPGLQGNSRSEFDIRFDLKNEQKQLEELQEGE